jgi:hypothetical protein
MFWHVPSTPHYCWSIVITISSSGGYTGGSHSIKALRRVVKQLIVEMFHQCPNARSCVQMRIVMVEHYIRCSVSHAFCSEWPALHSFYSFCNKLLTLWSCVAWIPFLSQKTAVISFLADNACLNFFGLFGECVCIQCFKYSLVSAFTNEIRVSWPVTHMMWLRNSSS